jgi:Flp pilus assembly protein TadD
LAPDSAGAANTLGTLLEALGHTKDARVWYRRALTLDPKAAYALNNDCYASLMLGDADAVALCRRAVDANPESLATRNNLALAYAAVGDLAAAQREFQASGTPAAARYNAGILYMAERDYSRAAGAFDEAFRLDARSDQAAERARQARSSALGEETVSDQH